LVASVDELEEVEFVPITFQVADDLAFWRVEIPEGRVPVRRRDSPLTLARPRVRTIDFARSELGSDQIVTWADSVEARTEGFGFRWMGESRPSKHVRFDSRGPPPITFGDLHSASPGQAIWYRSQQPSEILALMLLPSLMQRMPREHTRGASFGSREQAAVRDEPILHLGRTLQAEVAASLPSGRASGALLATALAIHLLQHHAFRSLELRNHRGGLPQASLRQVLEHIQAHLDQELPVTGLAALAQMSPFHFSRLFKQSTGLSPHQYLLRQRIERAKELLAEPRHRIAAVSYELGFPHQSHFTTIFRKLVGTTPRDYQRQRRGR
jgi:AraC family transcriptional regulator